MSEDHGVHFTSQRTASGSDNWSTPEWLFRELDDRWGFALDAAADSGNALCDYYMSESADALRQSWKTAGPVWLNPPYSKLREFLAKALHESERGATVVCLVPARTDTRAWHESAMRASRVLFFRGRLRFGGATENAPFPSALLVFTPYSSATSFGSISSKPASTSMQPSLFTDTPKEAPDDE